MRKSSGPDDRQTPAYTKQDGVDYVPMRGWKNSLINLLNIAGTGPILGPIQGILFGPLAFITIPIGNVIGGAMHDYFSGMICLRDGGTQMPDMIKRYSNKGVYTVYNIFLCLLLLLVGAVFVYTPRRHSRDSGLRLLRPGHRLDPPGLSTVSSSCTNLIATVFPIDAIIGRIYPVFGAILLFSAVGVFVGIFVKGYPLIELWEPWTSEFFDYGAYFGTVFGGGRAPALLLPRLRSLASLPPSADTSLPVFFVTVACGILSGFHSTQTAIITRTMKSERQGSYTFYWMMILEGFIAMVWAAGAMGVYNQGASIATSTIGVVCRDILGNVGGIIAIIGVIVLPITSGDTALRALRLTLADTFHIEQKSNAALDCLAVPVFILVAAIIVWAKMDSNGFNILWRYFAWSNQTLSLFAFLAITVWMFENGKGKFAWIPLIPGCFYAFICSTYIANATIGFHLPWNIAYIIGVVFAIAYVVVLVAYGSKRGKKVLSAH